MININSIKYFAVPANILALALAVRAEDYFIAGFSLLLFFIAAMLIEWEKENED